jgi:kumamolisin
MRELGWLFAFGVVMLFTLQAKAQEVETVLRLKERVSMEKLADEVTRPSSERFQKFYSPAEIRQIAGPSDSDYQSLLEALRLKGFRLAGESKSHLFITVSAEQSVYENLFSTKIEFIASTLGRTDGLHRSLGRIRIPSNLALIQSVIGLDNTRVSKHRHSVKSARDSVPLEPSYIQSAYGFTPVYKSGITGKGQHIAIATYDGFFPGDIDQYFAYENIDPRPKVDTVLFNGQADVNVDSSGETELDTEFSGALAPNAEIHVFTSAHNDDQGEVQLFNAILDDNRAKVANYSWGDCEANVTPQHAEDMNQIFARAVAQGVNITVAAGDWGAYGCPSDSLSGSESNSTSPGKYNADWPAANPYVIAVGGTSIDGGDNGEVQETAWVDTGGGVSSLFDQPSWQKGFQAPFLKRSFPDVAFNADPNTGQNALIHLGQADQEWVQIGGTSIGAPQWAGFLALVGEARGSEHPLGYLNPIVYSMTDNEKKRGFHDVIRGNNGGYSAQAGWDATTGWGSMRANDLLEILKAY